MLGLLRLENRLGLDAPVQDNEVLCEMSQSQSLDAGGVFENSCLAIGAGTSPLCAHLVARKMPEALRESF